MMFDIVNIIRLIAWLSFICFDRSILGTTRFESRSLRLLVLWKASNLIHVSNRQKEMRMLPASRGGDLLLKHN